MVLQRYCYIGKFLPVGVPEEVVVRCPGLRSAVGGEAAPVHVLLLSYTYFDFACNVPPDYLCEH